MMYNINMAQKEPLTLFGFHKQFKTQEDCEDYLFNIRWPKGYVCPRCEESQYGLIKSHIMLLRGTVIENNLSIISKGYVI